VLTLLQTTNDEKPVWLQISEKLWLEAKARAAINDIPLKDWVAKAIENELNKSEVK
jgi:hypothetical protein